MIELVKLPKPVPFVVMLFEIVGEDEIFQQTPRAVTAAPPSLVIVPPLEAVIDVIAEITVVLMVGKVADVVKVNSFPYAVPTLLVA